MTYNEICTLIGSYGFPIVCCGAMFWYINNTMRELTKTIYDNTSVMQKLLIMLERDSDK